MNVVMHDVVDPGSCHDDVVNAWASQYSSSGNSLIHPDTCCGGGALKRLPSCCRVLQRSGIARGWTSNAGHRADSLDISFRPVSPLTQLVGRKP